MRLGQAMASGRQDNLQALRLVLAAAVVVSHAWPLSLGPGTAEPLEALTGHSLGGWAVAGFFFLSGLLISGSAARSGLLRFCTARARRILPGLAVALLVTLALAALSGALLTPGGALFYWLRGITLISLEHSLPNAFADAPMPGLVNGPLWSLAHEVAAYALCLAAVRLGLLRHPVRALAVPVAAMVLSALPGLPARAETFAPLFVAFSFGMLANAWRDRISLSPWLTLCLLLAAPLGWPVAVAALGHAALVLTYRLPVLSPRADLSYGIYIYGWPVAQSLVHHLPGLSAPALAVLSLAATLPLAAASWHLVERPALSGHRLAQGTA